MGTEKDPIFKKGGFKWITLEKHMEFLLEDSKKLYLYQRVSSYFRHVSRVLLRAYKNSQHASINWEHRFSSQEIRLKNTAVRNANDQLLQSRFISGLRNDIRRFVLSRDPLNLEESINAALIKEQNMKLNQIASEEKSGLSSAQTENPVLSALADRLQEINLRVGRLQEASAVTARKSGGNYFNRRENVFKCFYCGIQGHRQAECRKRQRDERAARYQPPRRNAASSPRPGGRHVHFRESAFRDNYAAPRHSEVLGDLLHHGALVYIDDIILFTKTIDEHFELLGFVVTPEGILIDKDKSVSINEFPVPKDQKQIKSFLGCCNFYRRYIKNFAKRALPLTNLLRKDTPFEWTSETQEAFDDIKKAILNPPVLALPDQSAELQITTDASSRGIGAVLEQKYPNSEVKPLYFF
ncbi:retrovirus-related Pol polyprotein from transposon 412 [Trichonephila clavipes]|uniref:RNA-directed DNA polymerase n=1 Tax=Trichonephila clavipes TaxID=2585209 RepID=A0A8X6UYS7_TRICX|nr:retrovirus-related Pol polyprotein from transposon 412 [Trichonephila clavipes]